MNGAGSSERITRLERIRAKYHVADLDAQPRNGTYHDGAVLRAISLWLNRLGDTP